MQIPSTQIKNCLDKAASKRDAYYTFHHNKNEIFASANGLLRMFRQTTGSGKLIELSFHPDSYKDHHIYSFLLSDKTKHCICLLSGMTNCWQRFCLCKELFHIELDVESSRNINLAEHVEDFVSALTSGDISGIESSKNEMLAEFAAMEFLFPFAKRGECVRRVNGASNQKAEYMEIAKNFRIPRLLVEEYLSKTKMDLFDSISWYGKSMGDSSR